MTKTEFEQFLKDNDKVLVDFGADWCPPCKDLEPKIHKALADYPDIKLLQINVDESVEIAKENNIRSIPTLHLYIKGELKNKNSGNMALAALHIFLKS